MEWLEFKSALWGLSGYLWIPFVIAIAFNTLLSILKVKKFWSQGEQRKCAYIIGTLGLSVALLSTFLIPFDVFLVSFMKTSDGHFKEWATDETRQGVKDSVTYTYYILYGFVFFYTFFILPLSYFSFAKRREDCKNPYKVFTTACVYTIVFLWFITGLLFLGIYAPYKKVPPLNSCEWVKIGFMVKELYKNRGKDALLFALNVLTTYGLCNIIFYTSTGLASLPLTLTKGFRSLSEEEMVLPQSQMVAQSKVNDHQEKHQFIIYLFRSWITCESNKETGELVNQKKFGQLAKLGNFSESNLKNHFQPEKQLPSLN